MTKYFETEIVGRDYIKERNGYMIKYPFRARAKIFEKQENETVSKLFSHLSTCLIKGRQDLELGCSKCDIIKGLEYEETSSSVMNICRVAGFLGKKRMMHPIVQNHFMHNDPYTIAVEIPVWNYKENRSGLIDLIRYNPKEDIVWILDFKPYANQENPEQVLSQLYWYKNMLHTNTGISLNKIECAYFNHLNFYQLCKTESQSVEQKADTF